MNISIFASIGAQNLWDELILKNEIELLKQEFTSFFPSDEGKMPERQMGWWNDIYFRVASYDPKNPVFQIENTQYFEYFPLWIRNPRNILRNIKNFLKFLRVIFWSDRVVIGWWGIIYDSELQSVKNPLDQWVFRTRIVRFFRKRIYFYALWIDIKNPENIKKLEKIFKNAWKITVRDIKSWEQLKTIWIQSEIVDDPVMRENNQKWNILWTHSSKKFNLRDFEWYDFSWKKVWLALRKWYIWSSWRDQIERLLIAELCSYIEQAWWRVIFLPHSFHPTDLQANDYEFMSQFLTRDREIYANISEVYTAYNHNMLNLVISMRLHSIILSYVYGIDQIALSYSQKTDEVIKKLKK